MAKPKQKQVYKNKSIKVTKKIKKDGTSKCITERIK